ncbi:hypothetical protein L5515_009148 [Caenorhabditis briggsae]|uniref:DUF38 domain-containing protein n=1 Tax=Caenorhabditis briggsae TaxID=6238 RepID=A0AAE9F843_CAEBR|nr:hypothetical protein L5515_009148 [Caenorhabditis briggsae]
MEELDFRSLVSLRKVCHDLCNFIDDVIPSSGISEIYVRINTKKISLRFMDDNIDFLDKSIQINYHNHKKGCSTVKNSSGGKKKKRVGLEDFVIFFWQDLETVLKHQKSILKNFSLVLEHYEEKMLEKKDQILTEFSKEIMEKIKENLTSRIVPLKVKEIDFGIIDQMEMLQILPFIDSKTVEKISIGNSKGMGPQNIKIDDITKLKQANFKFCTFPKSGNSYENDRFRCSSSFETNFSKFSKHGSFRNLLRSIKGKARLENTIWPSVRWKLRK